MTAYTDAAMTKLRGEFDGRLVALLDELTACAGRLDAGHAGLLERYQQLTRQTADLDAETRRAVGESAASLEACHGRVEALESRVGSLLAAGAASRGAVEDLRHLVDDGLARLDRLAGDVREMKGELRGEIGSLAARVDAAWAELDRRKRRSWQGRVSRSSERVRTLISAFTVWFRYRHGMPRAAANR